MLLEIIANLPIETGRNWSNGYGCHCNYGSRRLGFNQRSCYWFCWNGNYFIPCKTCGKYREDCRDFDKLKDIEADEENEDRKERTISNLWEYIEHESAKLSPYPGWFGYLLAMWFVVSCVSSYFANDVNHIATTILIFYIAIVFLCAFLWVFPRCKWGSEKIVAVWIFFAGLIGTGIGGYGGHQLAKANGASYGLIGPENVDAIGGLIGAWIGAWISKRKAAEASAGSTAEASEEKEGKEKQQDRQKKSSKIVGWIIGVIGDRIVRRNGGGGDSQTEVNSNGNQPTSAPQKLDGNSE